MADESGEAPSLRVMREAASRYIKAHGLRAFSREIDMSASGADKMVHDETRPQGPTLRKFRRWYLQAYGTGRVNGTGDGPALIGIKLLVQDLPRARQKATALHIHHVLREEFAKAGARMPRWVSRLKKLIEIEWS